VLILHLRAKRGPLPSPGEAARKMHLHAVPYSSMRVLAETLGIRSYTRSVQQALTGTRRFGEAEL
jgi:hypothetical protein